MRRKSKYLLACLLLLLGVSLSLAQGRSTATVVKAGPTDGAIPPNILWIVAEDLSPDLGCYGNRLVRTPNIDALAAAGVRFTRAFSTAPVCSPSRSALITGMYQTSIGAHQHRSHRGDSYRLPEGVLPFTHYFRKAGYHTSNVRTAAPGLRGTGKTDFNFLAENVFDGTDWNQRKPGQPFYAQVNFPETHRVFHRFEENPIDPEQVELPPYYPDHPGVRMEWAMYLDTVQHLDVKVGKVLKRLEEEGLADDTIVFFFSDHGRAMPRGKQFLYEGGIHVPLVVRIPKKFQPEGYRPGTVREDLVNLLDVTVSSLRLGGIDPPSTMQGRALVGPGRKEREYIVAARDGCDETADRIRCVRTDRYKYIRNYHPERAYTQPNFYKDQAYPTLYLLRRLQLEGKLTAAQKLFMASRRPAVELYDLGEDPHELRNLAASPAYQEIRGRLSAILDRWIEETKDQGEVPEDTVPEEFKYRGNADGWGIRYALASRSGGALKVECAPGYSEHVFRRSYVTEGGKLKFSFRARSNSVRPKSFAWGLIEKMRDPQQRRKLEFIADGRWRIHSIDFEAKGMLGWLDLDLGEEPGTIEFDWIRLDRLSPGGGQLIEEWDFS